MATGLVTQGVTLLVHHQLGPLATVVLTTSRTLANLIRQLVSVVTGSLWPELTRVFAERKQATLAMAHRLLVKLCGAGAVVAAAVLLSVGPDLHRWWVRGRGDTDVALLTILVLDQLLSVPWTASAYVMAATNRIRGVSALFAVTGLTTILGTAIVLPFAGLSGAAVVLLVTNLVGFGYLVPRWASTLVGESFAAYLRDLGLPFFALAFASIAVAWLGTSLVGSSLLLRTATGAIAGGLVAMAGLVWWLDRQERTYLQGAAASLLWRGR
jgi:O-antigen/teichoic acid export membrane protein